MVYTRKLVRTATSSRVLTMQLIQNYPRPWPGAPARCTLSSTSGDAVIPLRRCVARCSCTAAHHSRLCEPCPSAAALARACRAERVKGPVCRHQKKTGGGGVGRTQRQCKVYTAVFEQCTHRFLSLVGVTLNPHYSVPLGEVVRSERRELGRGNLSETWSLACGGCQF